MTECSPKDQSLTAATEAYLRVDYLSRVQGKKKDALSRAFRKLFSEKSQRTALDRDLLKVWKNADRKLEPEINTFTELLRFRHWIAHGRYWVNKTNKSYTPENVYLICDSLLNAIRREYVFYGF